MERVAQKMGRDGVAAKLAWMRTGWFLAVIGAVGCVVAAIAVGMSYATVPLHQDAAGPVDAVLVLGSPAEANGVPGDEERWRVDEAVREYKAGRARRILMSGGAVANEYAEADVMAEYAQAQGVPASAILKEDHSRNTLENIRNSQRLLQAHGWERVEVISSGAHLHRAALLLARTPLQWRTHVAPTPGRGWKADLTQHAEEAVGTALIRWCGLGVLPMLHDVVIVQHRVAFNVRQIAYVAEGWRGRV